MKLELARTALGPSFSMIPRNAEEMSLIRQFLALIEANAPITFEYDGTVSFSFPTAEIIPGINVAYSTEDLRVESRSFGALVATTIHPRTKKGLGQVERLYAKWRVQGAMTDIGENTKQIFTRIGKNKVETLCREDGTFVKSE